MFFANRNTQKNMQLLDKIHTVFTAALTSFWVWGRYVFSLDQEQKIFKSFLVAALFDKRDTSILMILRCSVVCVFSTEMVSDCHHSSCT